MKVCCIVGCCGPDEKDAVFFNFPTSRLLRKRWTDAISVSSLPQDAVICIRHFSTKDYELIRGKTRLKHKVVPSLCFGDMPDSIEDTHVSRDSTDTVTSRSSRSKRNTNKHTNNENNRNGDNKEIGIDTENHEKTPKEDVSNHKCKEITNDNKKSEHKNNTNPDSHNDSDNNDLNSDSNKHNESAEKQITDNRVQNDSDSINKQHEKVNNDGIEFNNSEILKTGNERVNNISEKINSDCENIINDSEMTVSKIDENVNDKSDNVKSDHENIDNNSEMVNNDSEKVKSDSETVKNENNDNGKVIKDNETVDNDNGKRVDNVNVRSKKTRCKITAKRAKGRRKSSTDSSSLDSVSSSPPPPPPQEIEGSKDDIEGILTNYIIENKKTERQVAAMTDVLEEERRGSKRGRNDFEEEFRGFEQSEPVFIELSVGQGYSKDQGWSSRDPGTENDCLMVLESVQCDVDPALLLAAREDELVEEVDLAGDDDDDPVEVTMVDKKREDPISLLTSSDEDDVIIQEPKIDTVEVSSADTSEDDMPLVKLLKKEKRKSQKAKNALITKILWGASDFFCVHCGFTTTVSSEYTKHLENHTSKVLEMCQDCEYTTCSKSQMHRHRRKHRNKPKFQCKKCNYSAKRKISLICHMKTHNNVRDVEIAICGTYEPSKASESSKASDSSKRSKIKESEKKHKCKRCNYKTDRYSDLRRHLRCVHKINTDDDDDDYTP